MAQGQRRVQPSNQSDPDQEWIFRDLVTQMHLLVFSSTRSFHSADLVTDFNANLDSDVCIDGPYYVNTEDSIDRDGATLETPPSPTTCTFLMSSHGAVPDL
jgi:hypothetical protein